MGSNGVSGYLFDWEAIYNNCSINLYLNFSTYFGLRDRGLGWGEWSCVLIKFSETVRIFFVFRTVTLT